MKGLYVVLTVLSLGACDNSSSNGVTMADAKAIARSTAGAGAVDCGTVEANESRADANCCLASNRAQSMPAFALYKVQAIDVVHAKAVSLRADGQVNYFIFDGDLGDFDDPVEGRINEEPCGSPVLAENACSNEGALPFTCSE